MPFFSPKILRPNALTWVAWPLGWPWYGNVLDMVVPSLYPLRQVSLLLPFVDNNPTKVPKYLKDCTCQWSPQGLNMMSSTARRSRMPQWGVSEMWPFLGRKRATCGKFAIYSGLSSHVNKYLKCSRAHD